MHGLLIVEDKLSMANSLETRVPFLDNDLVDFAMAVPLKYKLNNISPEKIIDENDLGNKTDKYISQTNDGKIILRKSLKNLYQGHTLKEKSKVFQRLMLAGSKARVLIL